MNCITGLCCLAFAFLGAVSAVSAWAGTPGSGRLLVANKTDRTLSVFEPGSGRQLAAIPVQGNTGHEVAASPDGKFAYVPIFGDAGVGRPGSDGSLLRVIDLESNRICGTVDFGKGVRPHAVVVGPRGGLLYVTTELENTITVVSPETFSVKHKIPTGQSESHMLAITKDGTRGYTANVGPGTISVLDLTNRATSAIIPVARKIQRISLSDDDRWIFTADQTSPRLAVIDAACKEVKHWVDLPGIGYGTAAVPGRQLLLAAVLKVNQVVVIDLQTMKVVRSLDVPRAPQEVLVRPDGREAYVSCDPSGKIAAVDLKDWSVREIPAGAGCDGLAWAAR